MIVTDSKADCCLSLGELDDNGEIEINITIDGGYHGMIFTLSELLDLIDKKTMKEQH